MSRGDSNKSTWWRIDIAGAAACVVLSAVTYVAGVQPALQGRAGRQHQHEELRLQRQAVEDVSARLAAVKAQWRRAEEAVANDPLKLQPAERINQRIAEVGGLAGRCGLTLDDIQPGQIAPAGRCMMVPIRLTGRGAYRICTVFLHRLKETFPDTGVSSMLLSADNENPSQTASFQLGLVWHAAP